MPSVHGEHWLESFLDSDSGQHNSAAPLNDAKVWAFLQAGKNTFTDPYIDLRGWRA